MVRRLGLAIITALVVSVTPVHAQHESYQGYPVVHLTVNGQPVVSEVPSINYNGTTLVPLRTVSNALGAAVSWDANTGTVALIGSEQNDGRFQSLQTKMEDLNRERLALTRRIAELEVRLSQYSERIDRLTDSERLGSKEIQTVIEQAKRSIVGILTETADGKFASGSGFVHWKDNNQSEAFVLTNKHVIANGKDYLVFLDDGRVMKGDWWAADYDLDLGILKIEGTHLPEPLQFATTSQVKVGDPVLVIGNPHGLKLSVSQGIISGYGRTIDSTGYQYYQTDAAINSGNSGGPMLNRDGQVVGIVTSKLAGTGIEGLGFAIPISTYIKLIEIANQNGWYRAYFGLLLSESFAAAWGAVTNDGLTVLQVDYAGPAPKSGIRVGDSILKVNDQTVNSLADMRTIVDTVKPGSRVTLTIKRSGLQLQLPLDTGKTNTMRPLQATNPWEAPF